MPTEAIQQVHRMAIRAKMNKKLTFYNQGNEDTDALYIFIPDKDNELHDNMELTGVDDNSNDENIQDEQQHDHQDDINNNKEETVSSDNGDSDYASQ